MVIAEAGVEEAMAHLNSGVSTNSLAVNGWASRGGGVYEKTNSLKDSYYVVDIKIGPAVTNRDPVIVSAAYVPGPLSKPKVSRTVQVSTKSKVLGGAPGGMVSSSMIDLNGVISIDSFDSANTNYSTGGRYDPAKARDNTQLSTMSSAVGAIDIGNGTVKGYAHSTRWDRCRQWRDRRCGLGRYQKGRV